MSTPGKVAAVILGALAVLVVLALAGVSVPGLKVELDVGGDTTPSDDLELPWLCQPSEISTVQGFPHPLYRRPSRSRPTHEFLAKSGWGHFHGQQPISMNGWRSWYLAPPSEEG